MKKWKLTCQEVDILIDLVEVKSLELHNEIYDIHALGDGVPEYLVEDCNMYVDIFNKLLKMRCRMQKKKLFLKKEPDLPF